MPKKLPTTPNDPHGLIPWILARIQAGKTFHTGEILDTLHGFPGASFRDSEMARRMIKRITDYLEKIGEIKPCGSRWCDTVYGVGEKIELERSKPVRKRNRIRISK